MLLILVSSCAAGAPTVNLCIDTSESRAAVVKRAKGLLAEDGVLAAFNAAHSEHFVFGEHNVSYFVNFTEPPVGYVLIWLSCSGKPIKVVINDWGTLN